MWKSSLLPFSLVFNFLCVKEFINAAPTDYCNAQLNTSDCAMRPIPVFTYYKPGSRCEIELWRGCTTLNKFENEYECSHFCIGKLSPSFSAEDNEILSDETKKTDCEMEINLEDCEKREYVFTYNNEMRQCKKVEWKGCETYNKFQDYDSCLEACGAFMKGSSVEIKETESDDSLQDEDGSAAITLADVLYEYGGNESAFNMNSDEVEEEEEEETNDSQDEREKDKNKDEKSDEEEREFLRKAETTSR